eukprot:TRINITY_DN5262_c0_g1_i1.p1 TRINITY_DN5262_c0_g1~~TRINITY_DN5262_c0_g1_i1.p1  ORF type:complete len:279 (+),score=33.86 TRINITY_DN5262_c0_g1_i1:52-888(+)
MAAHNKQETLALFDTVRRRLHEGGLTELSLDFPIAELTKNIVLDAEIFHHRAGYLGVCHVDRSEWICNDGINRVAQKNEVKKVQMCLIDSVSGESIAMDKLIATLLHEFGHCITPGLQVYDRKNKWVYDAHGDDFYINFSKILTLAEHLGIYTLPKGFNKSSIPSLRRFDALDVVNTPFVGTTSVGLESQAEKALDTTQRFIVSNKMGEKKLIVVKLADESGVGMMSSLLEGCVNKFQIKRNKNNLYITNTKGDTLDEEQLISYVKTGGDLSVCLLSK